MSTNLRLLPTSARSGSERVLGTVAVTGLSHKSVPVEYREHFALDHDAQSRMLERVLNVPGLSEAVIVSTCNRVEFYTVCLGESSSQSVERIEAELCELFGEIDSSVPPEVFDNIYHLNGDGAIAHLFRVASGLDSMILGEPQILGQLKNSFELARASGATNLLLNRLFHRAFGVAKSVRTNTRIGHHAVSVCYAAKELAAQIFGDLSAAKVMLIGAGEVGTLAAKHLRRGGVKDFFIVNRTLERALDLANSFSGVPLSFEKISEFLPQADIIVGASSILPEDRRLIDVHLAASASSERRGNPQFYIDLGVPRNFQAEIGELSDVFLYNVDDLGEVVQGNRDKRELEADRAELIVREELERFKNWLREREHEPLIKEIVEHGHELGRGEIEKTLRRLGRLGIPAELLPEINSALQDLSHALLSKTFHRPIMAVRKEAAKDGKFAAIVRRLFLEE